MNTDARARRAPLACVLAVAMLAPRLAAAEDLSLRASPDRIEDVPSTRPDPFPAFSNFAWRAFIALSWPALTDGAGRGEPDRTKTLADPGARVWETFKSRYEIFQRGPDGRPLAPAPWNSHAGRNPCGGEDNATKTLASFEPFADFNQASFTPGRFNGPLVAQNHTHVRYETRINQAEFRSIVEHGWWRPEAAPTAEAPARFDIGSVAVKAAWRILTGADTARVRARYYVVPDAEVVDVATTLKTGHAACVKRDVALVGLNIMIKTKYRPQWIWSAFEHVDNVPPIGGGGAREPDARDAHAPYAFNDPLRPQREAASARAVGLADPPMLDPVPTQAVRRHPIHPELMAMNRAYWSLAEIRGTVWANYMLVATQWPTVTQPPAPENDGRYFPGLRMAPGTPAEPYQTAADAGEPDQNLANVAIETYAQDAPASCMACHHAASNARGRDFVAILPDSD